MAAQAAVFPSAQVDRAWVAPAWVDRAWVVRASAVPAWAVAAWVALGVGVPGGGVPDVGAPGVGSPTVVGGLCPRYIIGGMIGRIGKKPHHHAGCPPAPGAPPPITAGTADANFATGGPKAGAPSRGEFGNDSAMSGTSTGVFSVFSLGSFRRVGIIGNGE